MVRKDTTLLKKWFDQYVMDEFKSGIEKVSANILLKHQHTCRVCEIINKIAKSLNLSDDDCNLAYVCALMHDVGRFEQYYVYHTFRDSESEDHAELGIRILKERSALECIDREEQDVIKNAVRYHNKPEVPDNLDKKTELYCKLVRDADKLDIFHVVTRFYLDPVNNALHDIGSSYSKEDIYTGAILQAFYSGEKIRYSELKTVNDLKVAQLNWINNLYFAYSIKYLLDKGYLDIIMDSLTKSITADKIKEKMRKNIWSKWSVIS